MKVAAHPGMAGEPSAVALAEQGVYFPGGAGTGLPPEDPWGTAAGRPPAIGGVMEHRMKGDDVWPWPWVGCTPDGDMCPGRPLTRAEAAVLAVKLAHGPQYTLPLVATEYGCQDVMPDAWYAPWVLVAQVEGLAPACDASWLWNPEAPATREQIATLLRLALGDDGAATGHAPRQGWPEVIGVVD